MQDAVVGVVWFHLRKRRLVEAVGRQEVDYITTYIVACRIEYRLVLMMGFMVRPRGQRTSIHSASGDVTPYHVTREQGRMWCGETVICTRITFGIGILVQSNLIV